MKSQQELVAALKAEGMVFRSFTLRSEGRYAAADAEWNYKDVLHLFHVHHRMRPVLGIIEDDKEIFLNLQTVLGLRLPLSIVSYHPAGQPGTSYMSWLFYVLTITTRYSEPSAGICRIEATYMVGAPKLLAWTLPVIRWLIKRNHRVLAADDDPVRERRMELRRRGYDFQRSGKHYTFLETMDLTKNNVIPPAGAAPFSVPEVKIERDLPPGREFLVGDDGHFGLRLIRQNDRILVFPRMCRHEGASLDRLKCENGRLICPWHRRVIAPLAQLHAFDPKFEEHRAGAYIIARNGTSLSVRPSS